MRAKNLVSGSFWSALQRWIVGAAFGALLWGIPQGPVHAQETGPMLMKQELGYTFAGGVAGAGIGIVAWFTDPLNPGVTLRGSIKDGFVLGSTLGALFGFYLLQNAAVIPQQAVPTNVEDLLGLEPQDPWPSRSSPAQQSAFQIRVPLWQFRF